MASDPQISKLTYAPDENVMTCPGCGGPCGPHLEHVYVAAREEDREFTYVHVDAKTGEVDTLTPEIPPAGGLGDGRRHRIALTGYCDGCGIEFAVIFTQHKGATHVEVTRINEGPIYQTGRR
uniref:hypothetical protein n=1 Tax=Streptosporangium sp. CA-235898 TaxID=3240073 RepID=UPI003F496C1A